MVRGFCGLLCQLLPALLLTLLHPGPAEKAISIVDQKHHKADNHRQVGGVLHGGQSPQHDQHQIVGGVSQGKVGAAAEGEIDGQEAGSDGQRAGEQVCGVEKAEQEVKYHRHRSGKYQHKGDFTTGEAVDLHLGVVALERVAQPGHQRHYRHGGGHAQVGEHLAVVGKGEGNQSIQQAEQNHQHLACRIALGAENQGRGPNERGGQGEVAAPVKGSKGQQDTGHGAAPQEQLPFGEITAQPAKRSFHHKILPTNKKASVYTSSKT